MMKKLLTLFSILIIGVAFTHAQTVNLKTHGVSPREAVSDTNDIFDRAYNSLPNVGTGTKVYLKGIVEGGVLQAPSFTLSQSPAGSAAQLSAVTQLDSNLAIVSFIPDLAGTYEVQFEDVGDFTTIFINAGTYVGYDSGSPTCVDCHNNAGFDFIPDKWMETGHYSIFELGMNGILSDHYGENCIACHTTGYDPLADNNGFDDRGFVWPDSADLVDNYGSADGHLFPGVWDSLLAFYPDAMQLARIQCESCHGPGSEHFGQTSSSQMVASLDPKNCAWCHDSGSHHAYPAQYDGSLHADLDHPYTRSSCAPCHNGAGFVQYIKGGKQNLAADLPEEVNITCATCHDPHDVSKPHQVRTMDVVLGNGMEVMDVGIGALCMNCHKSRRNSIDYTDNYLDNLSSHYGPHHGPQADILLGVNMPTFGRDLPSSDHGHAVENACVGCHMNETGLFDAEGKLITAGSHSFAMSSDDGVDNMAACTSCHPEYSASFEEVQFSYNGTTDLDGDGTSEGLQNEVKGLLDATAILLPPVGVVDINVIDSTWTLAQAQAYYNYDAVLEDKSFGIHNPAFAVSLLMSSIDEMEGNTPADMDLFYLGNNEQECAGCHENTAIAGDQLTTWKETAHASAQDSLAFLQYSCLQCHNTGWNPDMDNYGADEYVDTSSTAPFGWVVTDEENWARVKNVTCETCHGPLGQADRTRVPGHSSVAKVELQAENCGVCHEGSHHPTYSNWQESLHAVSKFTSIPGAFEWIASNPNCAACHTAEGFIQFVATDDLEPQIVAPGAEGNDITCAACHDPHGGPFEGQLRLPKEEICVKCHNPEYNPDEVGEPDGSAVHHSTAYMFEGKGGYEYDGFEYPSSLHTAVITEKCARCHAHMTPFEEGPPEIAAYTGHKFVPTGEACVDCHSDFDATAEDFDYRGVQSEIEELLTTLGDKLAMASTSDSTSNNFFRAQFNYEFVEADGSHGIHNTKYAKALLESAIGNFTPTGVESEGGIPTSYDLSQNFPNPFNPSTLIKFAVPEVTNVKIAVYDAIGREVDVLINRDMNPGNYVITWNASKNASGIYFYRIITDNFVSTKKMLLLK